MKEIEAKVRVDSFEQVTVRLNELSADLKGQMFQRDTFYCDPGDKMIKAGCGLRLRRQTSDDSENIILTYKGPKEKSLYKSRPEIEVKVSDFNKADAIFSALGFEKRLVIEKRRGLWRFGGCEVCLDEVALLGKFIEVEGPDEKTIEGVMQQLGLAECEHINTGYASLISKKIKELSMGKNEACFENH